LNNNDLSIKKLEEKVFALEPWSTKRELDLCVSARAYFKDKDNQYLEKIDKRLEYLTKHIEA